MQHHAAAGAASASRATTLSPPPPRRVRERCRGRPARRATANPRLFGQPSTVEDPHAPHPAAPRACMLPAGPGAPRDIARPVQLPHAPPPRGSRASAAARSTPAQPLAICLAISSRFQLSQPLCAALLMADSGWFGPFAAETRRTTAWRGAMSCLVGEARGALALRLAKHPGHAGEALTFLSDLAPAEQAALIDSNERGVLPQVAPYQRFCHETARRLDARLREIASGRCSQAGTTRSRLSVMVDVASEGAATILQQWPERFDLLQALPMDGLPGPLRRQVWEMRLRQHLGAVAETDKLRSTDSDALVWNTCRDVVAVLGLPSLSYRVMPMKDVICHLRAVHHGPAWTPLYLVLAPLLEVALGDGGSSRASADEAVGDRERPHGVRGTLPPWCMDRSSPNGAEDGRGLLRCLQALLSAAGLHKALRDPYSLTPTVPHTATAEPESLEPAWDQGGSGADTAAAEWSGLVFAVSDCLYQLDAPYHTTLCQMLHDAAAEAQQQGSWRKPGGDDADAGDDGGAAGLDAEALQRAIDKAWDLRPGTVAALAASHVMGAPRGAHRDGNRGEELEGAGGRAGGGGSRMRLGAAGAQDGRVLGALVLPMVQRLFVGVIGSLETALFLWDVIMLHGAEVVPHLCAVCLLVLKGPLEGLISGRGQWAVLEKNLNTASKGVQLWQVQRAVHTHISAARPLPPSLSGTFERTPSLHRSLAAAQHGTPHDLPYALGLIARSGLPQEDGDGGHAHGAARAGGVKIRVRRDSAAVIKTGVATQTRPV